MLAFAAQGWFLKKNTVLETVLFAIGGAAAGFPGRASASIVQPLDRLDIERFVPGLSDIGVRVGYNVLLGLLRARAGHVAARASGDSCRPPAERDTSAARRLARMPGRANDQRA